MAPNKPDPRDRETIPRDTENRVYVVRNYEYQNYQTPVILMAPKEPWRKGRPIK